MVSERVLHTKVRLRLACLIVLVLPFAAAATDDSLAEGKYIGSCSQAETRLSFQFDGEGISKIRINGKQFGEAQVGNRGRFGASSLYDFTVVEGQMSATVQFLVLFDEKDRPRQVTGFFTRWNLVPQGSGIEGQMTNSCTLSLRRVKAAQ